MATEPACQSRDDQADTRLRDEPRASGTERAGLWHRCRVVLVGAVVASITDRITLAAAGCAFYATLALFPAISTLISVYGLAFNPREVAAQLQVMQGLLPEQAFALINDRVQELGNQPAGSLSTSLAISFMLAFWSASTGTKSVLSALNVVHDVREQRSVLRFQLTGLAMTLAAVLVAALAIALLVFIPAVLAFIGLSRYSGGLLHIAAMALLLSLFGVSLAVFYRIGPSRIPPSHQPILPGIVLATLLWLAASTLLSWYVSHIARFGATYGPLGAVVGIMLWFYVTAYVVLLGAELNARLEAKPTARTPPNAATFNTTPTDTATPNTATPNTATPNTTPTARTPHNTETLNTTPPNTATHCTRAAASR